MSGPVLFSWISAYSVASQASQNGAEGVGNHMANAIFATCGRYDWQ